MSSNQVVISSDRLKWQCFAGPAYVRKMMTWLIATLLAVAIVFPAGMWWMHRWGPFPGLAVAMIIVSFFLLTVPLIAVCIAMARQRSEVIIVDKETNSICQGGRILCHLSDVARVETRLLPNCDSGDVLSCLYLKFQNGTEQDFPIWFSALHQPEAQRTADSLNLFLKLS